MTAALAATFCVSADVVQYYDPTDPASPRKEADCTPITSTTTTLAPGWYAVDADVTMTAASRSAEAECTSSSATARR